MKNWIARRQTLGDYHNLMRELEAENPEDFQAYTRMEPAMFRNLLDRIEPRITKQTTNMRTSLKHGVKLAITLRYLATGSSYKGHAARKDIVDDIVDVSSSTMAFNVAKIASARASLTISLTKSLRVAGPLHSVWQCRIQH